MRFMSTTTKDRKDRVGIVVKEWKEVDRERGRMEREIEEKDGGRERERKRETRR